MKIRRSRYSRYQSEQKQAFLLPSRRRFKTYGMTQQPRNIPRGCTSTSKRCPVTESWSYTGAECRQMSRACRCSAQWCRPWQCLESWASFLLPASQERDGPGMEQPEGFKAAAKCQWATAGIVMPAGTKHTEPLPMGHPPETPLSDVSQMSLSLQWWTGGAKCHSAGSTAAGHCLQEIIRGNFYEDSNSNMLYCYTTPLIANEIKALFHPLPRREARSQAQ